MQVRSSTHLGQLARSRRLELRLTQASLARAAGVSRQWIVAFEAGKPTAELGSALRVIRALDLAIDVAPAGPRHGTVDLNGLLDG